MNNETDIDQLISNGMNTTYQKLFPYLNTGPVPTVSQFYLENFFFEVTQEATATTYYQNLKTLHSQNQREAMESAAATFISTAQPSTSVDPSSADALAYFIRNPTEYPTSLQPIIQAPFNENSSIRAMREFNQEHASLMSTLNSQTVPIWLSIMSLIIQIDYELPWLEELLLQLKKTNVLSLLYQRDQLELVTNNELVALWWQSNFLLPIDIFPLPKSNISSHLDSLPEAISSDALTNQDSEENTPEKGEVMTQASVMQSQNSPIQYGGRYYALGRLNIVKYRLTGYELGELQNVETILQGEMRENRSRTLISDQQQQEQTDKDRLDKNTNQLLVDKDLNTYVKQVLSERTQATNFNDYQTSYTTTSPNATTTGGWNIVDSPAGGQQDQREEFIKNVLSDTKNKAEKEVNEARLQRISSEKEHALTNRFYNKSERNINGFYYWLNKKYHVTAFDLSKRLLIEINFPIRSADLESLLEIQQLLDIEEPKTLTDVGVNSFQDIQSSEAAESDNTLYYLNLAQQFNVTDLPSPKTPSYYLTQTMKSDQATASMSFAIPQDYQATAVSVMVYSNAAQTFNISVGDQPIALTTDGAVSTGNLDLDESYAIMDSLSIAVLATSTDASELTSYVVNAQVTLTATTASFNQWQYRVYQELQMGYEKQVALFLEQKEAAKRWLTEHDTPVTQALINNYLSKQGMRQLYRDAMERTGGDPSYPHDELPYMQYFESALEWSNIYCKLFETSTKRHNDDLQDITTSPLLSKLSSALYLGRFLVSTRAKILIPVKENQVVSFLYFLDSGQIWHGDESLTPVNQNSLAIVSDYKKIPDTHREKIETGSWNLTLPTNMIVLGDDDLRNIGGHLNGR